MAHEYADGVHHDCVHALSRYAHHARLNATKFPQLLERSDYQRNGNWVTQGDS